MTGDEGEIEAVVERALNRALDGRSRIDAETHKRHHDYVGRCIERDIKRERRLDALRTHVIGWALVSGLAAGVYALGEGFRQFLINLFRAKGGGP